MTAVSASYKRPGIINPGVFLFLIILLFGAATGIMISPRTKATIVHLHNHAIEEHGEVDAAQARNCFEQNGVMKAYYQNKDGRNLWICRGMDGTYFAMIVTRIAEKIYDEISAYPIKDGTTSWAEVQKWLDGKDLAGAEIPADLMLEP